MRLVTAVLALKLDPPRDSPSSLTRYPEDEAVALSAGEGAVSVMVGTSGTAGGGEVEIPLSAVVFLFPRLVAALGVASTSSTTAFLMDRPPRFFGVSSLSAE